MDIGLRRFLDAARPRARRSHLRAYEDVVFAFDHFLRHRRRTSRAVRSCEIRSFLGYWYLRHHDWVGEGRVRQFCAALQVLVHWLSRDRPPEKARRLRAEAARVARETLRAARATDILQAWAPPECVSRGAIEDGYWEVLMLCDAHVVLRGVADRRAIGPVVLPSAVVEALVPGVVLNLLLVRRDAAWHVVEHGLCYPPVALPALRAASAVPA